MLAFRPAGGSALPVGEGAPPRATAAPNPTRAAPPLPAQAQAPIDRPTPRPPVATPAQTVASTPAAAAPAVATAPPAAVPPASAASVAPPFGVLASADDWLALVAGAGLKGPVRELAAHSAFCGHAGNVLQLSLPDSFDHLRSEGLVRQLANALAGALGAPPQIRFESARGAGSETLHSRTQRERGERQAGAEQAFLADPVIARLVQQGGTVVPDSIRPLDDH
jgi:DNA polymerase-3 subunit gamma/tau